MYMDNFIDVAFAVIGNRHFVSGVYKDTKCTHT